MAESVLDIVVALYSFNSNNDTELSFEKGDRLEIVDRPPADPEWFKARNQKGQIGLVPRNYLQELQEYLNTPYRGGPDSLDRRPEMPSSGTSTMQSIAHGANGNGQSMPMSPPVLSGKSWYYGAITRNQCDTVLNSHGHDGDFLIRDSETNVSEPRSILSLECSKDFCFRVETFQYRSKLRAATSTFAFTLKVECIASVSESFTTLINLSIITKERQFTPTNRAKNYIWCGHCRKPTEPNWRFKVCIF